MAAEVIGDRPVHVVAADADRLGGDGLGEAEDGDFRVAAADVADHAGQRLGHGQAGADGGGLGLAR